MTTPTTPHRRNVTGIVLAVLGVVAVALVGLGIAFMAALSQAQF